MREDRFSIEQEIQRAYRGVNRVKIFQTITFKFIFVLNELQIWSWSKISVLYFFFIKIEISDANQIVVGILQYAIIWYGYIGGFQFK